MPPALSPADQRERIWAVVHSIPRGKVASYGQVAERAGLPRAARLVGRVLSQLPEGSKLPWHRVVNSQRRISFPFGTDPYREQRERLLAEGILFKGLSIAKAHFDWD